MSDANCPLGLIAFAPQYRSSGVLVHITSLPSPYGIGDVDPAAFAMVDRLQAAGQGWWQALPLGPTGYGNSPYQCLSSFAGNGLLARLGEQVAQAEQAGASRIHIDVLNRSQGKGALNG